MTKQKDITGLKFIRLTALQFMYKENGIHFWLFKCDCGDEIIARKGAVTSGQHKSCGCLRLEKLKQKKYNEFIIKDNYANVKKAEGKPCKTKKIPVLFHMRNCKFKRILRVK